MNIIPNKISFNADHLEAFWSISTANETWGKDASRFLIKFFQSHHKNQKLRKLVLDEVPKGKINRNDVFSFIKTHKNDPLLISLVILSWGGITVKNLSLLMSGGSKWNDVLGVIDGIVNKKIDWLSAYECFYDLQNSGLKGMGPAYYTKLIYFLTIGSSESGFIMDQWTARSMNLLSGEDLIKLSSPDKRNRRYVSPHNGPIVYKEFCSRILMLSKIKEMRPDEVELRMFSEGRGKGAWRNYVKDHG